MTKRRLLLLVVVVVVALAAWFARNVDFASLLAQAEPIALPTAIALAVAGVAALFIGIAALMLARRKNHKDAKANDDALRVIRMQRRKASDGVEEAVIINTPPLAPVEGDVQKPANSVNPPKAPALVTSPKKGKLTVDDGIYFEPVICAPTGAVTGFNVFRRLLADKKQKSFARYATHLSKAAQAKLEADGIVTATSEARRVLERAKSGERLWVDVPLSEALLADRVKLQSVLNLMSAHPTLKKSIRLLVDGRALFKARKAVLDALKLIQREGVTMALNLAEHGRPPIQPELLAWFDALYVAKSDVQQAVMRHQADVATSYENKAIKTETSSLLGTLAEARRLKMTIIAANVVCEPDAVDMLAEDIELMAGNLFGEPRAIKAKLLKPTPALDQAG